jgi:hypothetical protein
MPTAVLALLHVVEESHPEAVCAAALTHVAAAAAAQLPIKLVVLHNRPGYFEKPLRTLIAAHISNVVFCTYTGLLCGSAARALFGDAAAPAAVPPTATAALDASTPLAALSMRFGADASRFIGGPGLDSSGWGISQRQLSDVEALQCLLAQVAVGCARSGSCAAVCVARATTVLSYDDLWRAFLHFRKVPGAGGPGVMLRWLDLMRMGGGTMRSMAGLSQTVLVRHCSTPARMGKPVIYTLRHVHVFSQQSPSRMTGALQADLPARLLMAPPLTPGCSVLTGLPSSSHACSACRSRCSPPRPMAFTLSTRAASSARRRTF